MELLQLIVRFRSLESASLSPSAAAVAISHTSLAVCTERRRILLNSVIGSFLLTTYVHFYPGDVLHSCIVRERDGEEQENKDHHQRHFARIAFLILSHRRYNVIMRLLIKPPLWSQRLQ